MKIMRMVQYKSKGYFQDVRMIWGYINVLHQIMYVCTSNIWQIHLPYSNCFLKLRGK